MFFSNRTARGDRYQLERFEPRILLSGEPSLVADLNATPTSPNDHVVQLGTLGNAVYFSATEGTNGAELWKSDGTGAGTALVKDIYPGPVGSSIANLAAINGKLFFSAVSFGSGSEPWMSDGTSAGTVQLREINAGGAFSNPANFTGVGPTVFFTADDGTNGAELWKTDGTTAGTVLVKDIFAGSSTSSPANLINVAGTLFFTATDGASGVELWKSDGTSAGTQRVKDIAPGSMSSSPTTLVNFNGSLLFAANDGVSGAELWKSDGSTGGTVLLKDINAGASSSSPANLVVAGSSVFFSADDGTTGSELWKTDGTSDGTVLVKDIVSGGSSAPSNLTAVGTKIYFVATSSPGRELWTSDGTGAGTVLVKDINPFGNSSPTNLINVNGTLFFSATTSTSLGPGSGRELWKSNGTSAGTIQVAEINPSGDSSPTYLSNLNGKLYFRADDGVHGMELWRSDGSPAGTSMVKDVYAGTGDTFSQFGWPHLTDVDGTVYFQADLGSRGQLWKTDGTSAGTVLVKSIATSPTPTGPNPVERAAIGGMLFLTATDGSGPFAGGLWRSDGTADGTIRLLQDNNATNFCVVNDILYFCASANNSGRELWRSDGTIAGTYMVKEIAPGIKEAAPWHLTDVNGTLFFTANDGTNGEELWKSDGTDAGTVMVKDLRAGSASSSISNLVNVNGTLFFTGDNGSTGVEVYKSDGTSAGTVLVKDLFSGTTSSGPGNLTNFNGTLVFTDDWGPGGQLWRSDGTAAGTTRIPSAGSGPSNLIVVNHTLFLQMYDSTIGYELWKSDGNSTTLVKDIVLGNSRSSFPQHMTNLNGELVFTTDPGTGTELWISDGTDAGTVFIQRLTPKFGNFAPNQLLTVGNTLYFISDDGVHGRELWKATPEKVAPTVVSSTFAQDIQPQVRIRFSESVARDLSADALQVTPLAGGSAISASGVTFDESTETATFTLPVLPDGNYRAALGANAVADFWGNRNASESDLDFFVLAGDGNGNRQVEITDFNILAANFGKAGQTFSQGNYDRGADGVVSITDFNVLAAEFGKHVDPPTNMQRFTAGISGAGLESEPADTLLGAMRDEPLVEMVL